MWKNIKNDIIIGLGCLSCLNNVFLITFILCSTFLSDLKGNILDRILYFTIPIGAILGTLFLSSEKYSSILTKTVTASVSGVIFWFFIIRFAGMFGMVLTAYEVIPLFLSFIFSVAATANNIYKNTQNTKKSAKINKKFRFNASVASIILFVILMLVSWKLRVF